MSEKSLLEKYHEGFGERLKRRKGGKIPPGIDKAEEIVFVIIDDLMDRQGLDGEWSDFDEDIKEEILETLIKKVRNIL